eukprot:2405590-Rhodomonas_salina.1
MQFVEKSEAQSRVVQLLRALVEQMSVVEPAHDLMCLLAIHIRDALNEQQRSCDRVVAEAQHRRKLRLIRK